MSESHKSLKLIPHPPSPHPLLHLRFFNRRHLLLWRRLIWVESWNRAAFAAYVSSGRSWTHDLLQCRCHIGHSRICHTKTLSQQDL